MGDVLVLGGGICGLGTAMMLARDGHEVTVIEADPEGPPALADEAAESWERPGVGQFRLPHFMLARFRHVLDAELPDVRDALVDAGATRYDLVNEMMSASITDRSPRPEDDRYVCITARRPILEMVFAQKAEDERGVKILRGRKIVGLVTGPEAIAGVPHAVGVRTEDGDELRADILIDAMGRRSFLPDWLTETGARPPYEEAEDCGFTYYGRAFRSRDGSLPKAEAPLLAPLGSISILCLPGDNATWTLAVYSASGDMELKQLRFEEKWRNVIAAAPHHAQWLDGEPVGEFQAMAGIMDRYRRFVVDDTPVVTGLLAVADAWASTNPSFGRGVSVGMWHVQRLRDLLRSANGDPASLAEQWDAITESELAPWYWTQVQMDRARVAEILAIREGREPPADAQADIVKGFFAAAQTDPDVYRALLEVMNCLSTPDVVLAQEGLFEKMIAASAARGPEADGPSRAELLELIA